MSGSEGVQRDGLAECISSFLAFPCFTVLNGNDKILPAARFAKGFSFAIFLNQDISPLADGLWVRPYPFGMYTVVKQAFRNKIKLVGSRKPYPEVVFLERRQPFIKRTGSMEALSTHEEG
jgi:hypothetical protein